MHGREKLHPCHISFEEVFLSIMGLRAFVGEVA
jgi:hypothetical protein